METCDKKHESSGKIIHHQQSSTEAQRPLRHVSAVQRSKRPAGDRQRETQSKQYSTLVSDAAAMQHAGDSARHPVQQTCCRGQAGDENMRQKARKSGKIIHH
jgi:hypothetical protein